MFEQFSKTFSGVLDWLKGKPRISSEDIEQALSQIESSLIEADVPLAAIKSFLGEVSSSVKQEISATSKLSAGHQVIKVVHQKLIDFLGGKQYNLEFSPSIPSTILFLGQQGAGKTTVVAKLAYFLQQQAKKRQKSRSILMVSLDHQRPAAMEQLEILAKGLDCSFFACKDLADAPSAARRLKAHLESCRYDYVLVDTAGRMSKDANLMQELSSIESTLKPRHKLLVLDAMTGQASLEVAQEFDKEIGFDGAILSKMDSDTRGGAAFAFGYTLKKPVLFVGTGERPQDFEAFFPERMASRILGMGDVLTLIEKATQEMNEEERLAQDQISSRLARGEFSLDDFIQQCTAFERLGSLQKLVRYLPGSHTISESALEKGQKEISDLRAIYFSMTPKERKQPEILNWSRKMRISKGSGKTIEDINRMLNRFAQALSLAKMLKGGGKKQGFFK